MLQGVGRHANNSRINQVLRIADVVSYLEALIPPDLAEEWDNVGLLLGDRRQQLERVMTCLSLTSDVAQEAVERGAQLIVSHHPIMFRPVNRLNNDTREGRMLLQLIAAGVAVYSPHTGYDSAREGINQQLAEMFELREIDVLRPKSSSAEETQITGSGRQGRLEHSVPLTDFLAMTKERLSIENVQFVGEETLLVERIGIACGSAAEFLSDAHHHHCQLLLTGEARFHACLEARSLGMALVLPGHFATERPAMERLAEMLAETFPTLTIWASDVESDPVRWT